MIEFTVPAVPVAQPRVKATVRAGHAAVYNQTTIGKGMDKRPHPIVAFKATVRLAAEAAYKGPPLEGPIEIRVVFVLPRPKNKVWKTRPMEREPHVTKPDKDNMEKSVLDSLTGTLWRDDRQVWKSTTEKVIASGGEQPHVSIQVMQ